MDIHLTVELGSDGRLHGAIRHPAGSGDRTFSGALELVARLEDLCDADQGDVRRKSSDLGGGPDSAAGSINSQLFEGEGQ